MTSFKSLLLVVVPAISSTLALTIPAATITSTPVQTGSCFTTTVVTTPPAPTGGVPLWWQCGGLGYTGPDICGAGSKCVPVNQYYYQCQPVPGF
ncbi:hypothetical protein D9613_001067 [Agrocybe pediades]|uniref:CBM1 domain-containing protein n=1 Tax=Agrocybe pediades TaxID=84607 RepID=A0A8H4QZA7_9AGAR|nr:hypothetical protein D9613_001067 [Agrocybe pediades]